IVEAHVLAHGADDADVALGVGALGVVVPAVGPEVVGVAAERRAVAIEGLHAGVAVDAGPGVAGALAVPRGVPAADGEVVRQFVLRHAGVARAAELDAPAPARLRGGHPGHVFDGDVGAVVGVGVVVTDRRVHRRGDLVTDTGIGRHRYPIPSHGGLSGDRGEGHGREG